MATPTHESYAAAKPSILAWLFHSADLGVAYGASHLTCAADLLPPKDALLPMGDVCDYSLFCTVDSDLPGKGLPVGNVEDTTFIDKQSHTALTAWLHDLPRWRGCFVCAWRLSRGASTPPSAVDTAAAEIFAASVTGAVLVSTTSVLAFVSFLALSGIRRSPFLMRQRSGSRRFGCQRRLIHQRALHTSHGAFVSCRSWSRARSFCSPQHRRQAKPGIKHVESKATFRNYMARLSRASLLFRFTYASATPPLWHTQPRALTSADQVSTRLSWGGE